jgi:thiamine biosynthesis lipoprotein
VNEIVHRSFACMGTVVTLQVVGNAEPAENEAPADLAKQRHDAMVRAQQWFYHIEKSCNRFDASSELRRLSLSIGGPVAVSDLLLQAVQFALAVAEESNGAFDPTVGGRMEARGFNRCYQSGEITASGIEHTARVSYRDVEIDAIARTITLHAPLLLDLGAVVKGLAIDLAAHELRGLKNFQIDAGGDVYVEGNARADGWMVGVRHPRERDGLISTLHVTNTAVCTSGDYEHTNAATGEHHIMNAISGETAGALASVTVLAPSALVADALATAAFALGPQAGMSLIEKHKLQALFVTPALQQIATKGLPVV